MQRNLRRFARAGSAVLVLAATGLGQQGSLMTVLDAGNNQDGCMFDLMSPCDVTVDGFEVYFAGDNNPPPCGTTCSVNEVEVYTNTTGWSGNETNAAAWTLLGNVQHTISVGNKMPQPLNLPVNLPVGSSVPRRGVYVTSTGATNSMTGLPNEFINYTNSAFVGQTYTHGDLVLEVGTGNIYPFGGTFAPRTFNGAVHYTQNAGCTGCVSNPVNYCTPGTSASGCQPTLSVIGTPSVTKKRGFVVYTTGMEGQKDGIFFYGQNGRQASPWGNGSSYQCVAPPVKRTPIRNGKGTTGQCDGWAQRDLNTDWCPTCPKNPPILGVKMQIQFWYRDPLNTSNQTTSLSDAIEVDVCP